MITDEDIEIRLLLEAIFLKYQYDFRGYSMASLKRRLTQARMRLGCETFTLLQDRLLRDPSVMTELLAYLTVPVSEMFRDPPFFRTLREQVAPRLRTYPSLKVWIAGCSTGEELYSVAILFREEGLEERTLFYATDINPDSLKAAQAGVYDLSRIALFTSNHQKSGGKSSLSNYYTTAYQAARFDSTLTRNVVFSDHSLTTDQVFGETHLILCRNVLIYFDRPFQDRAIGLFRDSLVAKGYLGLGAKENLRFSVHAPAFTEVDRETRLYQKVAEL